MELQTSEGTTVCATQGISDEVVNRMKTNITENLKYYNNLQFLLRYVVGTYGDSKNEIHPEIHKTRGGFETTKILFGKLWQWVWNYDDIANRRDRNNPIDQNAQKS